MLEILTIAGVATVLSGVAQNVVGNIADRQICSFVTDLKARTRRNADSSTEATARVVRLAQLQALDGVVRAFQASPRPEWVNDPALRPDMFFDASRGYIQQQMACARDLKIKIGLRVTNEISDSIDAAVVESVAMDSATRRLGLQRMAEAATLTLATLYVRWAIGLLKPPD